MTIFACFLLEAASRSCGPDSFWLLGSQLFVLGGGLVSPGWWGGGSGREGPQEKRIIPNPVLVASQVVPERVGAVSLASQLSLLTPLGLQLLQKTGTARRAETPQTEDSYTESFLGLCEWVFCAAGKAETV